MQKVLLAAVLALSVGASAVARPRYSDSSGEPFYMNVSGHHVHRPTRVSRKPSGATAHCGDGSWSFSEHHQGTWSHHGGVADWE